MTRSTFHIQHQLRHDGRMQTAGFPTPTKHWAHFQYSMFWFYSSFDSPKKTSIASASLYWARPWVLSWELGVIATTSIYAGHPDSSSSYSRAWSTWSSPDEIAWSPRSCRPGPGPNPKWPNPRYSLCIHCRCTSKGLYPLCWWNLFCLAASRAVSGSSGSGTRSAWTRSAF